MLRLALGIATLSPREKAVARRVVAGCSNKVIAHDLGVSVSSVATYIRRSRSKLRAVSRTDMMLRTAASDFGPVRDGRQLIRCPDWCELARSAMFQTVVRLSPSEGHVAGLLLRGLSYGQIARLRRSSPRTIAVQIAAILRKFSVRSRYELVAFLRRRCTDPT